jgi:hypothetical protein
MADGIRAPSEKKQKKKHKTQKKHKTKWNIQVENLHLYYVEKK